MLFSFSFLEEWNSNLTELTMLLMEWFLLYNFFSCSSALIFNVQIFDKANNDNIKVTMKSNHVLPILELCKVCFCLFCWQWLALFICCHIVLHFYIYIYFCSAVFYLYFGLVFHLSVLVWVCVEFILEIYI